MSGSGKEAAVPDIIEVDKLTKSYGGKRGIKDVSFSVAEGEVFGFLGPNGAGKTTTIRTLMALIRADSGTARIAGLDCWGRALEIKRLIGYVPGEPALDRNLTGGQTNLRKMIPLCWHHHRLVHEGGWQVLMAGEQLEFIPPERMIGTRRRWGEGRWAA